GTGGLRAPPDAAAEIHRQCAFLRLPVHGAAAADSAAYFLDALRVPVHQLDHVQRVELFKHILDDGSREGTLHDAVRLWCDFPEQSSGNQNPLLRTTSSCVPAPGGKESQRLVTSQGSSVIP